MSAMQKMQGIFNSRMEPIESHEDYPKYARSATKPVARARQIIDNGIISDHPCSTCVDLKQDCYRWEGTFSKCAYCTSKDKKKEFCHLPGQEALQQERRKRRKITHNICAPAGDAASIADTTMSGTLVTGTLASGTTPFSDIPLSIPKGVLKRVPSPIHASAMTSITPTQIAAPPPTAAASEVGSEAALERVTALENQVSGLESKVMELLVKLDEVSSCVSSSSTPRRQAVAGASPTTSDGPFEDLQARHLSIATLPPPLSVITAARRATREWVEGPKTPELSSPMEIAASEMVKEEAMELPKWEHTVEHAEAIATQDTVKEEAMESLKRERAVEHHEEYKLVDCGAMIAG